MADADEKDQGPTLEEVPTSMDTASPNVGTELLISPETMNLALKKVYALEAFFALATKNCDFKTFIREVLMTVLRVVECEAGSILEVDHSSETLFFRSVVGRSSDRVVNFVIPFGQGIVGQVVQTRIPAVVQMVAENIVHLRSIEKAVGFDAKNLVALPIIIRGKVYGVIELLNRIGGTGTFSPDDLETLNYVTDLVSKVIEIRFAMAWTKNRSSPPQTSEAA